MKIARRLALAAVVLLAATACSTPAADTARTTASSPAATPAPATTSGTADPSPAQPESPQTFTFPDGHISFTYPAGWAVKTQQGPYLDEGSKASSVEASVLDQSGAKVASIFSGMYGDGAAGEVRRTVLDHAPVPGIRDAAGKPAEFGFAYDEVLADGSSYYFMDVRLADEFLPSRQSSGSNQVRLANGIMSAYIVFDFTKQPVFATPEAARAWMATEQYAQLKALLLSLKYT